MAGPGYYWIGEEEEREILDVIRAGRLFRYGAADDPDFLHKVKDLEIEVGSRLSVPYSLAVSSGTAALMTALTAIGLGPGDEVIVPGYTFIASISSVILCNAVPVLAEIDDSLTLDPADVERKITSRTKAIIAVHMIGNSCDMKGLKDIASRHNLTLIEDAAQAFGGRYDGVSLGTIGDIGTFSFNIFKTINAGDGGMVVTSDEDLYTKAFAYHDQGHLPLRLGVEVGKRSIIGQNYRMTELSAAVLLAQLRKLDAISAKLRGLKARFKSRINHLDRLGFRRLNDPDGDCATILTVLFPDKESASQVTTALGTCTLSNSGWHVYNNMEQILEMKTLNPRNNPLTNQHYDGSASYRPGMLPETDGLLERAMNISIGVVDAGIGSSFGVDLNSSDEDVDCQAELFCKTVDELT